MCATNAGCATVCYRQGTVTDRYTFNSVIEGFEMTAVTTVHGAAGIMRCVIEERNGTRAEKYVDQCFPCLAVYKDIRTEGKGCKHAASPYHVLAFEPVEKVRENLTTEARRLRFRPSSFLAHVYEVWTLKDFPAGTCFAFVWRG